MFDRQPENIRRTALYAMSYWVVYRAEEANNTGNDVQFWSDVAMDNVLLIQVELEGQILKVYILVNVHVHIC